MGGCEPSIEDIVQLRKKRWVAEGVSGRGGVFEQRIEDIVNQKNCKGGGGGGRGGVVREGAADLNL